MNKNYTRQRQGRDFPDLNAETKKAKKNNKTLLQHLERCKEEAERNAVPTDGHEPVTERAR